jgi:hypothetical protein
MLRVTIEVCLQERLKNFDIGNPLALNQRATNVAPPRAGIVSVL